MGKERRKDRFAGAAHSSMLKKYRNICSDLTYAFKTTEKTHASDVNEACTVTVKISFFCTMDGYPDTK